MADCKNCGRTLTADEIGLTMKMINRGATEWMCIQCLSEFFSCEEELLYKKIEEFRALGCMLFSKKDD